MGSALVVVHCGVISEPRVRKMRATVQSYHHASVLLPHWCCLLFLLLGTIAPVAILADDLPPTAQTIHVSTAEELSRAIDSGNAFSASNGPDVGTVILAENDIQLTTSMPAITGAISIEANSLGGQFEIAGGGPDSDFRAFEIDADGDLLLVGVNIVRFAKVGNGGAILVKNGGVLVTVGCQLTDNQASMNGGGIAVETGGKAGIIDFSRIKGNNAGGSGGGIWTGDMATLNIANGVVVQGNKAGGSGGGIFVGADASLDMNGARVIGNEAGLSGGGLSAGTGAKIEVKGGEISKNIAKIGGAFSNGAGADTSYQRVKFDDNNANDVGCTGDGPAMIEGSSVSERNTPCQSAHFDVLFGDFFLINSFIQAVHILNCTGSCTLRNNALQQSGSQN